MDIFDGRYYSLNKKFLAVLGLWPYEVRTKKLTKRFFFMGSMVSICIPHAISAILHYENTDRIMLNILTVVTGGLMLFKMIALAISEKKIKELYESVANNWLAIRDEREREILMLYSERARKFTVFYATFMAISCAIGASLPLAPVILDQVNPLDKPRPQIYLMDGEYFVDRTKHFIEIFLVDVLYLALITYITITNDTIYIVSSEHCCALNAIISYRLQNISADPLDNSSTSEKNSYSHMVSIIQLHRLTFSFTSIISDSYTFMFLYLLLTNILAIPLDACAILAHLNEPLFLAPYAILFGALTLHLFTIFYPGQRVLDHNFSLCVDAYGNEWYNVPFRTKKILLIFMMRCSQPASLSAAGFFEINLETYFFVMKTAISYITVLWSFR